MTCTDPSSDRGQDQPLSFMQQRRWLRTQFSIGRKHLDYRIDSKREASLQQAVPWDSISGPATYTATVDPDRELYWVCFVMTGLAAFAVFRGGPALLTFSFYGGVMLAMLLGLWLTRRKRRVGYTTIPAAGVNILVLDDPQHDTIIAAIERARAAALMKLAEPAIGISIRAYLRRLRWLVENGVMSRSDFTARQKELLPGQPSVLSPEDEGKPQHFRQRHLGASVDIDLLGDRLIYRRSTLFGSTESFSTAYRDLREPAWFKGTDHQVELTAILFAWGGIAAWAIASYVTGSGARPANYYVGNAGFWRALTDYGPPLLAMGVLAPLISRLTRLRFTEPYPNIRLICDRQHDAILAAIEERRAAAQRALAEPDPLLAFEEQMQTLDELADTGVITEEERDRAAKRAMFVCDNPALDRPVVPEPAAARRGPVH